MNEPWKAAVLVGGVWLSDLRKSEDRRGKTIWTINVEGAGDIVVSTKRLLSGRAFRREALRHGVYIQTVNPILWEHAVRLLVEGPPRKKDTNAPRGAERLLRFQKSRYVLV